MSDVATRPAPNLLANPLVKAGLIVAAASFTTYLMVLPSGGLTDLQQRQTAAATLAAAIALLRPLLGPAGAERAALVIVPLLTLLAAQLCIGRIVARQFGAATAGLATSAAARFGRLSRTPRSASCTLIASLGIRFMSMNRSGSARTCA